MQPAISPKRHWYRVDRAEEISGPLSNPGTFPGNGGSRGIEFWTTDSKAAARYAGANGRVYQVDVHVQELADLMGRVKAYDRAHQTMWAGDLLTKTRRDFTVGRGGVDLELPAAFWGFMDNRPRTSWPSFGMHE